MTAMKLVQSVHKILIGSHPDMIYTAGPSNMSQQNISATLINQFIQYTHLYVSSMIYLRV